MPYLVNKMLAFCPETIAYAEMMNRAHQLDKQMQHDFYFNALPKKKRYTKWVKAVPVDETVELIAESFCINTTQAQKYLSLLTPDQVEIIRKKASKGGRDE